ncbi:hypothetical protein NQ315_006280 [Exocentrus adspersus]|uniref:Reverse transcriptase n=1 Tax=Exocentrus adspersus TaxID=1586481 RepID=A0AAV8W1H1_9CUCU|nr:hypothetical protein NQ315_006280 [Exocentrus adspersus]
MDRQDGYGGIAILVQENMPYSTMDINRQGLAQNTQVQGILLHSPNVAIINIYNPPDTRVTTASWRRLVNSLPKPVIITGDFNGHHPMWGCASSNLNGRTIVETLEDTRLIVLNDGTPTRLTPPNQNPSAVDLTLSSSDIASRTSWRVIKDSGMSDHFPILTYLNHDQPQQEPTTTKRRLFKKANWNQFHDKINEQLTDAIDSDYQSLFRIIEDAAEDTIPYAKNRINNRNPQPWWDEDCTQAVTERRNAIKRYTLDPTMNNYLHAKKTIAASRKTLRRKRKESFRKFCSSLNRNSSTSMIWQTIRRFTKNQATKPPTDLPSPSMAPLILDLLTPIDIEPDFTLEQEGTPEAPFRHNEYLAVLQHKKESAPGMDQVSYSMLAKLPIRASVMMVDIYNKYLQGHSIPSQWKNVLVYPFLKQEKNPELPQSYRPIALASCPGKVLESMIKNRVEWHIESEKLLPPLQFGFRRGKGCNDCIAYITSYIQLGYSRNEHTIATFLDIHAAYDNVDIYILYQKMESMGISSQLRNLIFQFLNNRNMYIKDRKGTIHGPKTTNKGLAQGSPLSPTLFNIYTADIGTNILRGVQLIQYADDLVLLSNGKSIPLLIQNMNSSLQELKEWLAEHKLTISPAKSSAILFKKKNSATNYAPILYNETPIPWKKQVKYLGVMLSHTLNWTDHVELINQKALKGINVMRAVCGIRWGADPSTLLMLYKGIVRPHLDYGTQFIKPCPKQTLAKLDKTQYQALRVITGCMRSTPTNVLLAECAEPSLEVRRNLLATKFILNIRSTENHPLAKILRALKPYCDRKEGYWRSRDTPYPIQAMNRTDAFPSLYCSQLPPCYEYELSHQLTPIPHINLNSTKADFLNNLDFSQMCEERYRNETWIYTDGSLERKQRKVGFGVYIPSIDYKFSSRLQKETQICTAEIIAINHAICVCLEKNITKAIIWVDSKSAIERISSTEIQASRDFISLRTKRLLLEAGENGTKITLGWIPGHFNIKGNQTADTLAKIGRDLNVPVDIKVDKKDILAIIREQIRDEWNGQWSTLLQNKGAAYRCLVTNFPKKPWFSTMPFKNRRHLTTIIRMRTGHCLTYKHLNRIGILDTPNCECGQVGDLTHIILECPINEIPGIDIYVELSKAGNPTPMSIYTILRNLNVQSTNILINFLNYNNVNL